jgi:hypothetical protein
VGKRPDGGKPSISRPWRVPAIRLNVLQKSNDQRRIQLLKDERGRRCAMPLGSEAQQELK